MVCGIAAVVLLITINICYAVIVSETILIRVHKKTQLI